MVIVYGVSTNSDLELYSSRKMGKVMFIRIWTEVENTVTTSRVTQSLNIENISFCGATSFLIENRPDKL